MHDPVTARAYVFGGMDGEVENSEAWQLDLTGGMTWTALAPTGPPPPARTGHAALFDLSGYRRHILVFGGNRGDTCRADLDPGEALAGQVAQREGGLVGVADAGLGELEAGGELEAVGEHAHEQEARAL